jgi:hypothetical protein
MKKSLNIMGYIAVLLLFSSILMKSNHLPGANIVVALSGYAISIYLPFLLFYRSPAQPGRKVETIVGAIATGMITLGITLKIQHMPGASVSLVLGMISLALVYVPMLIRANMKEHMSNRSALMITSGGMGATLFVLGLLFKIMHWPGANIMLIISPAFIFLGYFLLYLLDRTIDAETKTAHLRKAYSVVIIGCLLAGFILVDLKRPWIRSKQNMEVAEAQRK